MSDLGPISYGDRDEMVFLGRELTTQKNYSERTAEQIDEEVQKIIGRNYERAETLINTNKKILIKMADALLDKEVLTSDEIESLINGNDLPKRPKKPAKAASRKTTKKAKPKAAKPAVKAKPKAVQEETTAADSETKEDKKTQDTPEQGSTPEKQ
jgi:cell division protease FtsH